MVSRPGLARSLAQTGFRPGDLPPVCREGLRPTKSHHRSSRRSGLFPAWSPDGQQLAFTAIVNGNPDLYLVGVDGRGLRQLTDDAAVDVSPAWSPTGRDIAFVSDRGGTPNVYIVSGAGGPARPLTREAFCDSPAWSVLNEIAYGSRSPGGWVIKIVRGFEQDDPMTTNIAAGSSPTFSPDGRRVAFVAQQGGQERISVVSREGTDIRQITSVGRSRYPAWAD